MPSRTPWLSAWFPVLLAAPLVAQRANPVERQLVAAGLWAEARYNYAYWDAGRANWDSAFAATVSYAGESPLPSNLQFFRRLRRWAALLHDGQLDILPPASIANRIARPPLALRSIERRPFIMDYVMNDEMRVARPERLAEILAVQGVPAAEWIRDSVLPEIPAATETSRWDRAVAQMLEGERGASVTRSMTLLGGRSPLERPALEADTLPDGAIWVRVYSFADPEALGQFDRALGDAPREGVRHRGLILDLRETVGGGTVSGREQAYAFLSRLIERPFLGSRRSIPEYRPDSLGGWLSIPSDTIWPPVRRERIAYTGPVVVLISPRTRGAAEDFVAAFQAGGRGASIGESSAGSTGKTATLTLSSGWKLRVTVSRDAFPDGKEFVPTGIAPQFPVEVRVEDILAGRDAVLDRARAYLSDAARR